MQLWHERNAGFRELGAALEPRVEADRFHQMQIAQLRDAFFELFLVIVVLVVCEVDLLVLLGEMGLLSLQLQINGRLRLLLRARIGVVPVFEFWQQTGKHELKRSAGLQRRGCWAMGQPTKSV